MPTYKNRYGVKTEVIEREKLLEHIHEWWNEFDADTEERLENMVERWYDNWNYAIPFPSYEGIDNNLNYKSITKKKFEEFFIEYFEIFIA